MTRMFEATAPEDYSNQLSGRYIVLPDPRDAPDLLVYVGYGTFTAAGQFWNTEQSHHEEGCNLWRCTTIWTKCARDSNAPIMRVTASWNMLLAT